MDQRNDFTDLQEQRLDLYYRRYLASAFRAASSDATVSDALSIAQDARLPRVTLEFRLDRYHSDPCRWPVQKGLGKAIETYVSSLRNMEDVRRSNSSFQGLTSEHRKSLEAVVSSARALEALGWPVNWEQNVQAILETTEYGLRDGQLVHRFEALPDSITLGDEMLMLGTLTFYRQKRAEHGHVTPFKAVSLSAANKARYDNIELHLRRDDDEVPSRFQYCSDWLEEGSHRIAI